MRHRKKRLKVGSRTQAHRDAMLRNLATSVVLYEKVKTTQKKAQSVAPLIEKLIVTAKQNQGKKDEIKIIRKLKRIVLDENAAKKLLEELKERYQNKNSGYTRIVNLGFRKGDAAPLVQIELT